MSSAVMDDLTTQTKYDHYHIFHAEADVLSGTLQRPIEQKIEPQVPVALKDRRGGHFTRVTEDFSVEGFISFKRGLTRVSGNTSVKSKGWTTLSTSILEELNAFEVITADRVVSQVSTHHPYENGHVPDVTFLGTQFRNLQVSGYPVKAVLDLGVCGPRPTGDLPYITNRGFLTGARDQIKAITKSSDLPKDLQEKYDERLANIDKLLSNGIGNHYEEAISVTCSLVHSIDIEKSRIPGLKVIGNVLVIPDFGSVALAEVEVGIERVDRPEPYEPNVGFPTMSNYFKLTMLEMKLGCIGHGTVTAGSTKSNGNTKP